MDKRIANQLEDFDRVTSYYPEDPSRRSVDSDGDCMYNAPDGRKCAAAYWASLYGLEVPVVCESRAWAVAHLPFPEIPCVPPGLVRAAQDWHDHPSHWGLGGRESKSGEARRETIRQRILEGQFL